MSGSSSRRHQDWDTDCKVYVGGLRSDANKYDIEDEFSKYGNVLNVWIAQRPPGFGFVLFDDHQDAQDSVKALDGEKVCGYRVKVEMASGRTRRDRSRSRSRDRRRSRSGSRDRRRSRSRSGGRRDRRRTPPRSRRDRSRSGGRRRGRSGSDSEDSR